MELVLPVPSPSFNTIYEALRLRFRLQLLPLLLQDRPAAQLDLVALERQHLHQNLIALIQLIAHFLDAVLRNLGNMQQPVRPRENLHLRSA